jgi:hypothetical protein
MQRRLRDANDKGSANPRLSCLMNIEAKLD